MTLLRLAIARRSTSTRERLLDEWAARDGVTIVRLDEFVAGWRVRHAE